MNKQKAVTVTSAELARRYGSYFRLNFYLRVPKGIRKGIDNIIVETIGRPIISSYVKEARTREELINLGRDEIVKSYQKQVETLESHYTKGIWNQFTLFLAKSNIGNKEKNQQLQEKVALIEELKTYIEENRFPYKEVSLKETYQVPETLPDIGQTVYIVEQHSHGQSVFEAKVEFVTVLDNTESENRDYDFFFSAEGHSSDRSHSFNLSHERISEFNGRYFKGDSSYNQRIYLDKNLISTEEKAH